MPSSQTRYDIVTTALVRAGRGVELRTLAEGMLNTMLRQWATEYKYPVLRKIGSEITLPAGSYIISLPSDYGAGMESCLIGSGTDRKLPIYETQPDEFYQKYGIPNTTVVSSGRPETYMVDQNGNQLIFSRIADKNYTIVPVYYYLPADLPTSDPVGDASKVWMNDDELVIQGLIAKVYQYNVDPREKEQVLYVESLKGNYRRGSVPPGGGVSRVLLSRKRFKPRSR